MVADWRDFDQWSEDGSKTAIQRANGLWKAILRDFEAPPLDPARAQAMRDFIARRTAEGGAPPES